MSQYNFLKLSNTERNELIQLLEQSELIKVSPKMEHFREPWRIKLARGGRGAGGKSWACASLLVQRAHRECIRVGCFRETQRSLAESSYQLIVDMIDRLRYSGWKITQEYIKSPADSRFIFRGLADLRAAHQIKSIEGYDIFYVDEASSISHESIVMMLPTLRKPGSELWCVYNPETEYDAVTVDLWNAPRDDVLRIELLEGKIDNPWFSDVLQAELETAYRNNPDEALHVFGGQPRKQGDTAVMSRVAIRAAMSRTAEETEPDEVGVDVARFGSDKTEMYRRRGFKTIAHKEFSKKDTQFIADAAWDFAGRNSAIAIKVDDTGVGGGVTDRLKILGAKVIPVNFGGSPKDKNKYETVADEMWFEFPVDEASIPDDPELMTELSGRLYEYDKRGRRKVEAKEMFRKRFGRSPDKADGLLLAYYTGYNHSAIPKEYQEQMAARRKRRRDEGEL
jgi:phage terminase large subunit